MINVKVLAKKLKALKQDIIKDCVCDDCGEKVVYILFGQGSAVDILEYRKFDDKKITIIRQDGQIHEGYQRHECKSKATAEE